MHAAHISDSPNNQWDLKRNTYTQGGAKHKAIAISKEERITKMEDILIEGIKWSIRSILHGKKVMTDIKQAMVQRESSGNYSYMHSPRYYKQLDKLMQDWLRANFITNLLISETLKIIQPEEEYYPEQRHKAPPFVQLFWEITKEHAVFESPLVSGDKCLFNIAYVIMRQWRRKDQKLRKEREPKSLDKGLPQMISATASSDIPEHILQSCGYVPPEKRRQFNEWDIECL